MFGVDLEVLLGVVGFSVRLVGSRREAHCVV